MKEKVVDKRNATKKLAFIAVFAALAYAVTWLEFPIFPAAPFLKLDFSSVFVALGGFMFGPVSGVVIIAVKEFLCFITKSSTGGVGEIANFVLTLGFVIIPSIVYKYKKGLPTVIFTLAAGALCQTALALVANKFVLFPLYSELFGVTVSFDDLWVFVALFNVIKTVSASVLTILLYKRVSYLFKKF